MIGPIILQGPHHSAQKSTRTGTEELMTSESKFVSVRLRAMAVNVVRGGVKSRPCGDRSRSFPDFVCQSPVGKLPAANAK